MVWRQNLVACTLLNTLHAEDEDDGIGMYGGVPGDGTKGITRLRFFLITTTAAFSSSCLVSIFFLKVNGLKH
jgi:hypothetical protein